MKKIAMILAAVAAVVFVSCNKSSDSAAGSADLKSDVDTALYAIGVCQSNGIEDFLKQQGIDSTMLDEVLKGFEDASSDLEKDPKKAAYIAGVAIGYQMKMQAKQGLQQQFYGDDSTKTINYDNFVKGFQDGARKKGIYTPEKAEELLNTLMEKIHSKQMEDKYGDNKKASEAAMKKIAKQPGVKPLKDGIYYKVITEGKGAKPTAADVVKVTYKLSLASQPDSVLEAPTDPVPMPMAQVIPGFKTAITSMPLGSEWEVYIPYDQAYGSREGGAMKPFSALKFVVKSIEIVKNDNQGPQAVNMPEAQVTPAQ